VAEALGSGRLNEEGLNGDGVSVAVVDSGINLAHLEAAGHKNQLDAASSFTPAGIVSSPGQHPVHHGTMCAFDVGIAAPAATLVDHAVLLTKTKGQVQIEGLLSDAVLSFVQLRAHLESMPEEHRALVVNCSWGVFNPAWDFPTDHPGNYSDNPRHPFNLVVGSLEAAGADVVFAAGNCGVECPDGRCKFTERPIGGANSHPDVISVAGMDIHHERVGYSSQGPGRLTKAKPDICSYTHFAGSGVWPVDSGTSAAAPVLVGVIAAFRTQHPVSALSPVQLRTLLCKSATDLGGKGFDYDFGWGAVNPAALRQLLP
jgi:subtilisin family serine protease